MPIDFFCPINENYPMNEDDYSPPSMSRSEVMNAWKFPRMPSSLYVFVMLLYVIGNVLRFILRICNLTSIVQLVKNSNSVLQVAVCYYQPHVVIR